MGELVRVEPDNSQPDPTPRSTRWRDESLLSHLLVLLGFTGFAISQPLLGVLGDNPTVFRNNGVDGWLIVVYAVGLALVPPVLLWMFVTGFRVVDRRAGQATLLVVIGVLATVAAIQAAKSFDIENRAALALVALAVGVAVPLAYWRFRAVAEWARYTSVLPALAVGVFLFSSQTGNLLLSSPASQADRDDASDLPSVVMIVFDEFPTASLLDDGRIDAQRFPNLAAFSEEASWYRHNTTVSSFTASAVPSMLSGQYPRIGPPTSDNYPDTIFSMLAPTHDVAAFESATSLCNVAGCASHVDRGVDLGDVVNVTTDIFRARVSFDSDPSPLLDEFEEETTAVDGDVGADEGGGLFDLIGGSELETVPVRVDQFVESLASAEGPVLRYLHLMLPHSPWLFYDDGTRYRHADELGVHLPTSDRLYLDRWSWWESSVAEQRFLLQATYTDTLLGLMLDQMRSTGLYEDALVVVTADHGVSFGPRTHTREAVETTLDEIAYAPLLIKAPHQTTGNVDDTNLMTIDLLPTMAELIGVEPGWDPDGFAAGSPEIDARGDVKLWYDFHNAFAPELVGTYEYSDALHFPDGSAFVGPLADPDEPISGLLGTLNIDYVFGQSLDDLDDLSPDVRGEVELDRLSELYSPPPEEPPLVVLTGRLEGVPWAIRGSVFVLSINDTIVTGSRVSADADGALHIMALVPPDSLEEANDIRAALVTVLGVVELNVR